MPRPSALATCHLLVRSRWRSRSLPAILGLVALATTTGAVTLLGLRLQTTRHEPLLASAGIVLVGCALLQWRAAWCLWKDSSVANRTSGRPRWDFAR